MLAQYESEQGRLLSSDGVLPNGESNSNNDGLDQKTPSGEPLGGGNPGSSGSYNGTSEVIEEFRTPDGELCGFVDEQGNIYLDETKVTEEHYIHEYTHLWVVLWHSKIPNSGLVVWS